MGPKPRPPKETDQQETEKAYQILTNVVTTSHIERTLWVGAFWSHLVEGYMNHGYSYDQFCEELEEVKKCYKKWWEEDDRTNQ